jgi:hypothetical protein
MSAATRNITIYQGDTYVHELRLRTSANANINISSRTYTGSIKKRRTSADTSVTFSTEITDESNGVVVFSISSANTAILRPGSYVYDFEELNGSTVTTILTGNVTVTGQVTD